MRAVLQGGPRFCSASSDTGDWIAAGRLESLDRKNMVREVHMRSCIVLIGVLLLEATYAASPAVGLPESSNAGSGRLAARHWSAAADEHQVIAPASEPRLSASLQEIDTLHWDKPSTGAMGLSEGAFSGPRCGLLRRYHIP